MTGTILRLVLTHGFCEFTKAYILKVLDLNNTKVDIFICGMIFTDFYLESLTEKPFQITICIVGFQKLDKIVRNRSLTFFKYHLVLKISQNIFFKNKGSNVQIQKLN